MFTCSVCQSHKQPVLFKVKEMYYGTFEEFTYSRCDDCYVLNLVDIPVDLGKYYPSNYHCHFVSKAENNGFKNKLFSKRSQAVLTNNKFSLGFLINLVKPYQSKFKVFSTAGLTVDSRILDIGCGAGDFLIELRNAGFKNLTGVDPFLPEELQKYYADEIRFIRSDLFQVNEVFDFIVLNHAFEHMPDHIQVLEKIKDLLSSNGKICIRVPVTEGLAWEKYRENWYQLDAPRHLTIHSLKSMDLLLKRAGLRLDHVVFDSEPTQFTRSEIYSKRISSVDFLNKYKGDLNQFFSTEQIREFSKLTQIANDNQKGDQAAFFISRA